MRQLVVMLIIGLSSVVFTACNKGGGGGSASTPNTCTQNTYGQFVDQNGQPCTPGYNQYSCLGNTYMPPGAPPYNNGSYMTPGGMPAGNCQYANFQQTFPYNMYMNGSYMQGCQGWSMMYPGSTYYPVQVGPNYWVCMKANSFPWMNGMNYNSSMYTCIPGFNCMSNCRTSGAGIGIFPFFWLGGSLGVCY